MPPLRSRVVARSGGHSRTLAQATAPSPLSNLIGGVTVHVTFAKPGPPERRFPAPPMICGLLASQPGGVTQARGSIEGEASLIDGEIEAHLPLSSSAPSGGDADSGGHCRGKRSRAQAVSVLTS